MSVAVKGAQTISPTLAPLPGYRLKRFCARSGLWLPGVLLALLGLLLAWSAWSPRSALLLPGRGAWIRLDLPWNPDTHPAQPLAVAFRHPLPAGGSAGTLRIEAREGFRAFLDGRFLAGAGPGPDRATQTRTVPLPRDLPPGPHELVVLVQASWTHPLLKMEAPGLATDTSLEASWDGRTWQPAMLAAAPHPPAIAGAFPTAPRALLDVLPWLTLALVGGAGWTLLQRRLGLPTPRARRVRWVLLGLWAALAANNIARIPVYVGRDVSGHLAYIKLLAHAHRLPLATEGAQMFQPPLAYLLSAPLYLLFPRLPDDTALILLRVLPLLCGLLQVEVCYRCLRAVFPGRSGLQSAGTVLGGFLPMSLYMSQTLGNEPLAGLLSSLALLCVLQRWRTPRRLLEPAFAAGLGALLGLALLAKITVLLVLPLLAGFCLLGGTPAADAGRWPRFRFLAWFGAALALTSGWWFAWNWVHLGRPFLGGWDPAIGISWWQDPGYVTWPSLVAFGTALVRPVYAACAGFWNGLWSTLWLDGCLGSIFQFQRRPPWNYGFMLASTLTALVPFAAMAAGAVKDWRRPPVALCLACLGVLTLALLRLYLFEVPSYATLKASYLLGLLPCFAILGASGLKALPRRPWVQALATGLLSAWALSAFASYFVLRGV